jgi:2-oxoacid:acceptor oxidoreductase delta subunit (pyruvate/2-ketoisovalerate family)
VEVDTVIPALGQEADLSFLSEPMLKFVERGLIVTNEAAQVPYARARFAGGDAATGFGTVAHAIGSGKRAALAIDRLLRHEALDGFPPLTDHVRAAPRNVDPAVVRFEDLNLAYFTEEPRTTQPQRPAAERIKDFSEVNLGFAESDALREAERCLSCGTCNQCDTCWLFCPDVSIRRVGPVQLTLGWGAQAYEVDYDYCKGCGVCAEECPREAIAIEEELKWR